MTPFPHDDDALAEDEADLAAYGFLVAQDMCVPCRIYHSIWGYERLARVKGNGFEADRDILGPLFREHVPHRGRVMIGGAADAGLLALTMQEARSREPTMTVVDRCETPLAVCRRYAYAHGLKVATVRKDLTAEPAPQGCDLILVHNILLHFPFNIWTSFLRNVRHSFNGDGVLILVHRANPPTLRAELPPSATDYATRTLAALGARGIALPEEESLFRRRLEDYAASKRSWADPLVGVEHLESCLKEAGFAIARRLDHERRRTVPNREGGEAKPMPTHVFVAVTARAG